MQIRNTFRLLHWCSHTVESLVLFIFSLKKSSWRIRSTFLLRDFSFHQRAQLKLFFIFKHFFHVFVMRASSLTLPFTSVVLSARSVNFSHLSGFESYLIEDSLLIVLGLWSQFDLITERRKQRIVLSHYTWLSIHLWWHLIKKSLIFEWCWSKLNILGPLFINHSSNWVVLRHCVNCFWALRSLICVRHFGII